MRRAINEYLKHIIDEADFLIQHSRDLDKSDYLKNIVLRKAFERSLTIIGEAVSKIPIELREKYPNIAWRAIVGMRNILVHQYFGVDHDVVWDAVINEVPKLKAEAEKLIEKVEYDGKR